MGTDLESLINSGQPMAQIFFNSFGQKGTLALWAVVVLVQYVLLLVELYHTNLLHRYMMGSSMVRTDKLSNSFLAVNFPQI